MRRLGEGPGSGLTHAVSQAVGVARATDVGTEGLGSLDYPQVSS